MSADRSSVDEAVLFDMDGVIVDSERYWAEIEEERIFPAAGVPDLQAAEITGMNYREVYDYLDDEYGVTVDREEFLGIYEAAAREVYTERAALMDGFRDLCGTLRDRGTRLAIVSSSPPEWIDLVCDRFELTGFDATVSAEDIDGPGKPEPDVYRHAANELALDPTDCVAVEDSTHGVASATAVGMTCIGYRGANAKELDLAAADSVVDGPQELRAALLAR
ncbi:HAD family hydrolase [Halococcus agarilyticus]|uniref:HAD family hydrolase n=1 Tax=Halococcus agarilyticus TaxID=1232219 RepID=UPI0006776A1F|nr:HAD family phosphatase [Halococcus agarilyticus]